MRVKVCGITRVQDARLVQRCGADAVGFIFYKGSPRYVEPETAADIGIKLNPFLTRIGVFVNSTPDEINRIAKKAALHAVQLHGEESAEIEDELHFPVIRAIRVRDRFDFSTLNRYPSRSFLLDAFSDQAYGGTGTRFDWEQIPLAIRDRIILAGGISLENIKYVVEQIRPAAVDLSSSLESYPGIKDEHKVKEFFRLVNDLR